MGKQKGRFRKGKYVPALNVHIKAKRDKAGPHLDLTIRLDEDNVHNTLQPQVKGLGVDDSVIQRILRHSNVAVTQA